jgi:hypothetical protein
MTTIALTPEGEAFLARVRDELADLPAEERDELLEDIESHLAEVTGEGSAPLAVRLGSAEEFAQELRHSAGLPPRAEPQPPSHLDAVRIWTERVMRRGESLRTHLDAALVWRLGRGWLLAVAVAVTVGWLGNTTAWSYSHVWMPHAGLRGYGAGVALAGFVVLSFWIGRRAAAGHGVRLDRAASAFAILAVVPALWHVDNLGPRDHWHVSTIQSSLPGLYLDGHSVTNIFAYDRNGKPLNDVFLYLPDGSPLRVGGPETTINPNRRYLVTRRGERLYNSFPVRYFDPGTTRVANRWLGPSIHFQPVITPALGGAKP